MKRDLANGAFGLASSMWTYLWGIKEGVEESARFVGVVAGAAAAVFSLMIAIRSWRAKRKSTGE